MVAAMMERGINTVETSSCGRLFDAVSSILGICHQTTYEGQAATELEMVAAAPYEFAIEDGDPFRVDFRPAIRSIARQTEAGEDKGIVSARFHSTVTAAIVAGCERIRAADLTDRAGPGRVCLSGGTFQNLRLLRHAVDGLSGPGFEVFVHRRVPPNNGGLALGQAVVASGKLRERGGSATPGRQSDAG